MMRKWKRKALAVQCTVQSRWTEFVNDCSGSDTVEKFGVILATALVVGIMITAVKNFMPDMFEAMLDKAKSLIDTAVSGSVVEEITPS